MPAPRIADALKTGRSFSFEFFAPKTDQADRQFWDAMRRLEPLKPTFVSVTYGAGGTAVRPCGMPGVAGRACCGQTVLCSHHRN